MGGVMDIEESALGLEQKQPRPSDKSQQAFLELSRLSRRFDGERAESVEVIQDISLSVQRNQFVSVVGPSGCGKTTLFNIIAGIDEPNDGDVTIDGLRVPNRLEHFGYMLQKDLLLPWRTVLSNVGLGIEVMGVPKSDARRIAASFMEQYGLAGFEEAYPKQLSGGMRQRAALLRTLLCNRDIYLLDEPFGALDAQTREYMQEWLLNLWRDFRKTVLFITHDIAEAVYLSDVVVVLSKRPTRVIEILEVGLPRPRTLDVMDSLEFISIRSRIREMLHDQQMELG